MKEYKTPETEITFFESEDVITTSNFTGEEKGTEAVFDP